MKNILLCLQLHLRVVMNAEFQSRNTKFRTNIWNMLENIEAIWYSLQSTFFYSMQNLYKNVHYCSWDEYFDQVASQKNIRSHKIHFNKKSYPRKRLKNDINDKLGLDDIKNSKTLITSMLRPSEPSGFWVLW